MQVIDDFMPSYQFKQLQSVIMGTDFDWYYNEGILSQDEKDKYQFTHTLYDVRPPWNGERHFYPLVSSFYINLGMRKLYRVKANLNPRTIFHREGGYHTDDFPCPYTAVFYVNTNNGYTKIKGRGKVKSVANRLVIFDSSLKHSGFTCTDEKRRIVLNFNWE
tara:strand:+ start:154 stop:639 length:486 start_codon:yes stop_codon:yes gene_type:complete